MVSMPDATLCLSHPYPISIPPIQDPPGRRMQVGYKWWALPPGKEAGLKGSFQIHSPTALGWRGGSSLILKGQAEINQRVRLRSL